jgi:hypothetical protein
MSAAHRQEGISKEEIHYKICPYIRPLPHLHLQGAQEPLYLRGPSFQVGAPGFEMFDFQGFEAGRLIDSRGGGRGLRLALTVLCLYDSILSIWRSNPKPTC